LENAIERGVVIARGELLTSAELPLPIRRDGLSSRPAGEATLKEMEQDTI